MCNLCFNKIKKSRNRFTAKCCNTKYHKNCINEFLLNNDSCPNCKSFLKLNHNINQKKILQRNIYTYHIISPHGIQTCHMLNKPENILIPMKTIITIKPSINDEDLNKLYDEIKKSEN